VAAARRARARPARGARDARCTRRVPQDKTRKANVVAVGNVKVLKLTRATFIEQLGDLSEVVADNFKRKVLEGMMIDGTPIFNKLPVEDQARADPPSPRAAASPSSRPAPQRHARARRPSS
jgi:hypothetical protein